MQTINLDLSVRSIIPLLYAKQGDVGRKFKVVLTDNLVAYHVPVGAAISVWYSGPSGQGNYTDIGADSAVSVSGNEITVELITQMLANAGEGRVCLAINTADGDQIGTWNIPYVCEEVPGYGSEVAKDYFTAFSQAVENLPSGYVENYIECLTDEDIEKAISNEWSKMADYSIRHVILDVETSGLVLPSGMWFITLNQGLFNGGTLTGVCYSQYGVIEVVRNKYYS